MDTAPGLRILWRQRYALLLLAVLTAVAAYLASSQASERYEAEARAIVVPRAQVGGGALNADQLLQVSNTYVELARTERVLELTSQRLTAQGRAAPGDDDLDVTPEEQAGVLAFRGSAGSGAAAAARADAYVRTFAAFVDRFEERQRARLVARIEAQSRAIETQRRGARGTRAAALDAELQTLHQRAADATIAPQDSIRIIEGATAPSSPESPKPLRNAIVALLVGLVLWAALAYAWASWRDRYDSGDEAAADLGVPLLGQLPARRAVRHGEAEALRELRTKIEFALTRRGHEGANGLANGARGRMPWRAGADGAADGRVVLVTSPERRSGRSHVTASLAHAFAADGRRVVALEGDLRRPSLSQRLVVSAEPGVGDLARLGDPPGEQELPLKSVVIGSAVASGPARQAVPAPADGDGGRLEAMTAGSRVPDPVETLASAPVAGAVGALRRTHDLLVVDSPPVGGLADTLVLSRYADGVVLVVDARRTRRRDARDAVGALRDVDAPVIGLVFNRARRDRRYRARMRRAAGDTAPAAPAAA